MPHTKNDFKLTLGWVNTWRWDEMTPHFKLRPIDRETTSPVLSWCEVVKNFIWTRSRSVNPHWPYFCFHPSKNCRRVIPTFDLVCYALVHILHLPVALSSRLWLIIFADQSLGKLRSCLAVLPGSFAGFPRFVLPLCTRMTVVYLFAFFEGNNLSMHKQEPFINANAYFQLKIGPDKTDLWLKWTGWVFG